MNLKKIVAGMLICTLILCIPSFGADKGAIDYLEAMMRIDMGLAIAAMAVGVVGTAIMITSDSSPQGLGTSFAFGSMMVGAGGISAMLIYSILNQHQPKTASDEKK